MKRLIGILLVLSLPAAAVAAPSIPRHTVDGGGGTSGNAEFRVRGTVGQPEASQSPAGGVHWRLRGGFWTRVADAVTAVETPTALPARFQLRPNVPNPFNPSTTIRFDVPRTSRVRVEIYNLRGERIRVLRDETYSAGHHGALWDGKDDRGSGIASGVYLVRVVSDGFEGRQKVTLVK